MLFLSFVNQDDVKGVKDFNLITHLTLLDFTTLS